MVAHASDQILELPSPAGAVTVRLFSPSVGGAGAPAVILVGGVGGGFDSPAEGLYPKLAASLPESGVAVLRVRFRNPVDLGGSVADVRTGIAFLRERGHARLALVGHSFGGAVVVRAALAEPSVAAVVTLATQGVGTEGVGGLKRPLLVVHGTRDRILSPECSLGVHERAGEGAELRLIPGADHLLDEAAREVYDLVRGWLREKLNAPSRG